MTRRGRGALRRRGVGVEEDLDGAAAAAALDVADALRLGRADGQGGTGRIADELDAVGAVDGVDAGQARVFLQVRVVDGADGGVVGAVGPALVTADGHLQVAVDAVDAADVEGFEAGLVGVEGEFGNAGALLAVVEIGAGHGALGLDVEAEVAAEALALRVENLGGAGGQGEGAAQVVVGRGREEGEEVDADGIGAALVVGVLGREGDVDEHVVLGGVGDADEGVARGVHKTGEGVGEKGAYSSGFSANAFRRRGRAETVGRNRVLRGSSHAADWTREKRRCSRRIREAGP